MDNSITNKPSGEAASELSYLRSPEEIGSFLDTLPGCSAVGIDIEADGLHSYREKVCLVQVATEDSVTLLDPLSGAGVLAPLAKTLENPSTLKIFHGGDYDVRMLKKNLGCKVVNIFDTMIAAQFTGREKLGLASLLEEFFSISPNKKFQKANWGARPLTEEMLEYAALDVTYLFRLKELMEGELIKLGRLPWATEEFKAMEGFPPHPDKNPSCFDVKGWNKLDPSALPILDELVKMRDGLAKELDRPPFKVFGNNTLIHWAAEKPESGRDLEPSPGANPRAVKRNSNRILAAVKTGKRIPREEWPKQERKERRILGGEAKKILKSLKTARMGEAEKLGMAPGILVNGDTLERIAMEAENSSEVDLTKWLTGWRIEAVGELIKEVLETPDKT